MDAVEYLREKDRMCKNPKVNCVNCLMGSRNNGKDVVCQNLERDYPKKAVEIVERWSKEHPVKTYAQEFLEKFASAKQWNGVPNVCLRFIYGQEASPCNMICDDCWNRPMPEVE